MGPTLSACSSRRWTGGRSRKLLCAQVAEDGGLCLSIGCVSGFPSEGGDGLALLRVNGLTEEEGVSGNAVFLSPAA